MIEASIAQRWARALFQLAQEENQVAAVREQVNLFADTMRADGGKLADVLQSPSFSAPDKRGVVIDLAAALNALPVVKNFLALAMDKNRGHYLLPIIENFNRMADDATGIIHAELTVAAELPADVTAKITAALEKASKKKVQLEVKVDPKLIGGAVVKLGSLIVDGSLRSQLENLSRQLAHME